MNEHFVGGVVILAVILAAIIGVMIVSHQPFGKAVQMQESCTCVKNGFLLSVQYLDGYVWFPDGSVKSVGGLDENTDRCMQICAKIGAHT